MGPIAWWLGMKPADLHVYDLGPDDTIRIECGWCQHTAEYLPGRFVQIVGTTLAARKFADLHIRCRNCQAVSGFKISVFNERSRGFNAWMTEIVIVEP